MRNVPCMSPERAVRQIIVMGVSGVGKSTIAVGICEATGWPLAEGDDFHPESNVAKMRAGTPLTDEDRWPWRRAIGTWMDEQVAAGRSAVVTCSALRRPYRDLLRGGRPEVEFCHLVAEPDLVGDRLSRRGGHFMPSSLLPSQYATLEPLEPDEPGVPISVEGPVAVVLDRALSALGVAAPEGDD